MLDSGSHRSVSRRPSPPKSNKLNRAVGSPYRENKLKRRTELQELKQDLENEKRAHAALQASFGKVVGELKQTITDLGGSAPAYPFPATPALSRSSAPAAMGSAATSPKGSGGSKKWAGPNNMDTSRTRVSNASLVSEVKTLQDLLSSARRENILLKSSGVKSPLRMEHPNMPTPISVLHRHKNILGTGGSSTRTQDSGSSPSHAAALMETMGVSLCDWVSDVVRSICCAK